MNKSLRYISISHKLATATQREDYHISAEEKDSLAECICNTFPDIMGLFILVTCNRAEIYFESSITVATVLRDFFISLKGTNSTNKSKELFVFSNITEDSARHLLEVSSGLASLVLGDAEIIHQIKKSHRFSITRQLQGSLLERALQTVFKSHKRISNETHFRDGTTSIAYKSLKVISATYDKATVKNKKILIIGAGDIVKRLFKYNSKFNFNTIYISNRTEEKAIALTHKYQSKMYDWKKVLANDFQNFDVIIGAASNCQNLVKNIPVSHQKVLLIDLALPGNIDKALIRNKNIIFYDLDAISAELEDTKERRFASVGNVNTIIAEELLLYNEWVQKASLRMQLVEYKMVANQKIKNYFEATAKEYSHQTTKTITNRIMKKLMKQTETLTPFEEIDTIINEQVSFLVDLQ